MNLPGLHQRSANCGQGHEGVATIAIVFKSRPITLHATQAPAKITRDETRVSRQGHTKDRPAWHASVRDEVCQTLDGALLRRIKILITDGPQLEPNGRVWG
ncbi:MAG TPA: hypothetical protein VK846_11310 [Candidatus Limnocylindria bacterium]|nr:hypothetical protein [Candidatus Limnocylindria bacterium]